ncbi:hypothetical protein KL911_001271 [Ogataea haglerorum]|uniref:uncharacterized protein n=1 Tax=Ogataea haglerorum TaxID=1937702 RepID=UPI001C89A125|nr:uncharacterized protein KL911_001271 [Ogataea haglerorum]KAG7700374.1 hypothetical protein KL915_001063 [Ogataea haglerorum]KAG7751299.1 hypothetical protein KL912_000432 [Ogataea haglerorum]KAG7756469.1 hypothetical protein KL911_001271 [Ogataea haglerorum]
MALSTTNKVDPKIPAVLPFEKMYSIQVGDRLFRLSGASISFDSPSYFTSFFGRKENENKVLTVDRSAAVFDKICSHLQGYCIRADNEYELMHLYADATYFNLQKLLKQLTEEFYHCNVGGLSFRFPQELLAGEGNSPNYFTVAYQTTFQSAYFRGELKDMIRPPPQSPIVVKRSGKLFNDLLNALSTGRVCVESEEHRRQLLAECRYYRFLALEQKLIPHKIQMNPFFHREEIVVALADVKRDGLSISSDSPVLYKRPYVDAKARVLVLQIESEEASLLIHTKLSFLNLLFTGTTARRLYTLLSPLDGDMYESTVLEDGSVQEKLRMFVSLDECSCTLNGHETKNNWYMDFFAGGSENTKPLNGEVIDVKLLRSQWVIHCKDEGRLWFHGVLADGVLDAAHFNRRRGFL